VETVPHELFSEESSEIDERLRSYETVVAFATDDGGPLARRIRALGGGLVPPFPAADSREHATDFLVRQLVERGLARQDAPSFAGLRPTADDLERARALLARRGVSGPYVVVHTGAGGRSKRWPAASFAEAARRIVAAHTNDPLEVVALLGPAELDGPPEPALALPGVARAVLEMPPLATLAGILAGARLFLGNDGGIAHLAAAAGTPVVAVFGPTDPRVWGPRGRGPVQIVEAPSGDLSRLEPRHVADAALHVLGSHGASSTEI
jgi:ADP-heptose:LPS heptosyltransferase